MIHYLTKDNLGSILKELANLPLEKRWKITIEDASKRSLNQNALQWKWCQEIAEQKGDETANEIQAYNKLHFGVPILREIDEFRETYDRCIKPLPYEEKLKLMEGEMIRVTSLMNKKQKTRYLDDVYRHWCREYRLTLPDIEER